MTNNFDKILKETTLEEGGSVPNKEKNDFIGHLIKAYKLAREWETDDFKNGTWANETVGRFIEDAKKKL